MLAMFNSFFSRIHPTGAYFSSTKPMALPLVTVNKFTAKLYINTILYETYRIHKKN